MAATQQPQHYTNRDGVNVKAEEITEVEEGEEEYLGFYLLTDANGVQSRIPAEQFQHNFSPAAGVASKG